MTTADHVRLQLEFLADGLDTPTDIAFAPDGRIFIAERGGRVRVVHDGRLDDAPALTLDDIAGQSQHRLLALAVDPDFERTHFIYAIYTTRSASDGEEFHLARFREVRDTLADRVILLDVLQARLGDARASLRFGGDGKLPRSTTAAIQRAPAIWGLSAGRFCGSTLTARRRVTRLPRRRCMHTASSLHTGWTGIPLLERCGSRTVARKRLNV